MFILYQQDLLGLSPEEALGRIDDEDVDPYARALVMGTAKQQHNVDAVLERHVAGWSLERLGTLERSILRLAAYELLWEGLVPKAVVIDEAIELAKRFCSDEAGALVNGILGSIALAEAAHPHEIREGRDNNLGVVS